jgi:hypothetical protein
MPLDIADRNGAIVAISGDYYGCGKKESSYETEICTGTA